MPFEQTGFYIMERGGNWTKSQEVRSSILLDEMVPVLQVISLFPIKAIKDQ